MADCTPCQKRQLQGGVRSPGDAALTAAVSDRWRVTYANGDTEVYTDFVKARQVQARTVGARLERA